MRRLPLWSVIGLSLLALLGLAVVFRGTLTEAVVESYLARAGFPDANVEVLQLGLEQATVMVPTLGPGAPSAARIVLAYRPDEILGGRVREIRIDGLRLSIDLSKADPLGRYLALADGGGGNTEAAGPAMILDDAKVLLEGMGAGDLAIELDGRIDLNGEPAGAQLSVRIAADDSHATFEISASDLFAVPRLVIEGSGEADLGRIPWPADLGSTPDAGRAIFAVAGSLPIPWREDLTLRSMLEQPGSLTLDLRLDSVSVRHYAQDVQVAAHVEAESNNGAVDLRLAEPATFEVGSIDEDWLRQLGVELGISIDRSVPWARATVAAPVPEGPILRWSATEDGWLGGFALVLDSELAQGTIGLRVNGDLALDTSFRVRAFDMSRLDLEAHDLPIGPHLLDDLVWRAEGTADDGGFDLAGPLRIGFARLVADDWSLNDVVLYGPVQIARTTEGNLLAGIATGVLTIGGPPRLGDVQLKRPLEVDLENVRLEQSDDGLEVEATLDPGTVSGVLKGDGDMDFVATTGPVIVSMQQSDEMIGEIRLHNGEVRLPDSKILASAIEATVPFGTREALDPIRISTQVANTASPATFAPLSVTLEATREDATWRASGRAGLAGRRASLSFSARYDSARATGDLALGPGSLEFRSDALQPDDLSPRLSELRNAEGVVEVEGAFTLRPKAGIQGQLLVALDTVSVDTPAGRVEGLSGAIDIDRIMPFETPPRQELKIERLVAALPLEDISIRWRLGSQAGTPLIELEHAEGRTAGGIIQLEDTVLQPGASSTNVEVRLKRLSLASLFEELAIEALSGTGELSGTIPVSFGDEGVVIENGILRAEETGVLRVRLGETKDVLVRQGEQVALMVEALENFHYETLEIRVIRPPDAQLELGIHMEGSNPDVMDGHPFRFNISLSGKLEPVLAALHEGRALTTDLLQGILGSGR